MGLHVAQMTSQAGMRDAFDAVTTRAARAMGLADYGIAPGNTANLVLLQARDVTEAIRLRAARLKVWRAGRLLAESEPQQVRLELPGRAAAVDFLRS